MNTFVILLRGITPTGSNRVPMAELRLALTEAGLVDVRTYIQSGNVIAGSPIGPLRLEALVHDVIAERIGADLAVIVRTPAQLRTIFDRNPFADADSSRVYFTLLASIPDPKLASALNEIDMSPDEVKVDGSTIYTRYATRLSDSRYTNNFFERRLKVAATTRNFNTLSRLVDLCD